MKILKFGAVWCNGCLVMRPRWQEIEDEMPELRTVYYDFDKDKAEVEKWEVEKGRLPVFIFVSEDGEELQREAGEVSKKELLQIIEKYKEQ